MNSLNTLHKSNSIKKHSFSESAKKRERVAYDIFMRTFPLARQKREVSNRTSAKESRRIDFSQKTGQKTGWKRQLFNWEHRRKQKSLSFRSQLSQEDLLKFSISIFSISGT